MTKTRTRITIDVEFEAAQEDTSIIQKQILSNIENHLSDFTRRQEIYEINGWSINARIDKPIKGHIQTQTEKITPFANITAYFSSDGPAFVASIHPLSESRAESEIISLTLSDINVALREAHHKYLIKLRE